MTKVVPPTTHWMNPTQTIIMLLLLLLRLLLLLNSLSVLVALVCLLNVPGLQLPVSHAFFDVREIARTSEGYETARTSKGYETLCSWRMKLRCV